MCGYSNVPKLLAHLTFDRWPFYHIAGDHDDRVVPLHSFKHIATLQHELADNKNPLLLRVQLKAGHGVSDTCRPGLVRRRPSLT